MSAGNIALPVRNYSRLGGGEPGGASPNICTRACENKTVRWAVGGAAIGAFSSSCVLAALDVAFQFVTSLKNYPPVLGPSMDDLPTSPAVIILGATACGAVAGIALEALSRWMGDGA